MEVIKKELSKTKYQLKISFEPSELTPFFQKAYEDLAPEVKISGFRPGKAPRKLIEEAIGVGKLLSTGIDLAISDGYSKALQKENLRPVSQPKIAISKYPKFGLTAEEISETFEFEIEIEILPEVKLGDFSKVKISAKKTETAKPEDIEKIILHLRRQKATFSEVDRGVKNGDRVEINFDGSIAGVKKDGMAGKNQPVIVGDGTFIPGFEDNLIGMKKDEEKKFKITFPKDYHAKDFAGEVAEFEVKLIDVKEVVLPEVDDKFSENFGHKNVKDLKTAIEKSLKTEIEAKAKNDIENEIIEKVLPFLKVEIPESLIEDETTRIIAGIEQQSKDRGIPFDKYLESIKKTLPEMRADLKEMAKKNVKIGLLLGKIIEDQKFDHADPESGRKALDFLVKKLVK